jgi:alpha-tubulin suppressor-like RCC1 family protein
MKQRWDRVSAGILSVGLAVSCGDSQTNQAPVPSLDGGSAGEPFVAGAPTTAGASGGSAGLPSIETGGTGGEGGARKAEPGAAGDEGQAGAGGAAIEAGPVTAIGVGYLFACAVVHGKVRCWGDNRSGQVGNGSVAPEDSFEETPPSEVKGLGSPVSSISVGYYHACALVAGGVWCWGLNQHGQLGNDSVATSPVPVSVESLGSDVVALSAGANHTCAQLKDGTVYCWGYNEMGQLGDNSRLDRHVPTPVHAPETGLSAVDAGEYQTCALTQANTDGAGGEGGSSSSNAVLCWGQNNIGASPAVPTAIEETSGASFVSTGGNHACMLHGNEAACWGINHYGVVAEETWIDDSAVPVVRPDFSGLSALSAGAARNCAIKDGAAFCWGTNHGGEVGDGSAAEERRSPTPVAGLGDGVTAIDAGGGELACAIANGHAYCWGRPGRTPVLIQGLEL